MRRDAIRIRQKLGKYRIDGKLDYGGFAAVYRATDTLEGVRVALKIPHNHLVTGDVLADFRTEIRLAAKLKHANILPLKTADFIEGRLVLAYPLGERTLAERIQTRVSLGLAIDYAEQMLAAAAYAHEQRIIHCDIKPENLILFPDQRLMLTDFGIAKVALRTIRASGSGTVGYCAPEQAMGQPSFRSDVFSLGLIQYRLFSGQLPEWPFQWPPPGYLRLKSRLHPDLIELIRRAIELDPRKRFAHAGAMLSALRRIKSRALKRRESPAVAMPREGRRPDWRTLRVKQFQRRFGAALATRGSCGQCAGPVSESMSFCPWCGADRTRYDGDTRFPQRCPRCRRGMKLDWVYCPWCYGSGFDVSGVRAYSDKRYSGRCSGTDCPRKQLMPFMRYCPWCRRKVRKPWLIEGSADKCPACGWGVVAEYWSYCPWCGKRPGGA
jgi:eukaryotic-like serine/threonine-protein kinase